MCSGPADAPADVRERVAALERAAEGGPLYAAATRDSAVSKCRVGSEGAAVTLSYETLRAEALSRSGSLNKLKEVRQTWT